MPNRTVKSYKRIFVIHSAISINASIFESGAGLERTLKPRILCFELGDGYSQRREFALDIVFDPVGKLTSEFRPPVVGVIKLKCLCIYVSPWVIVKISQ